MNQNNNQGNNIDNQFNSSNQQIQTIPQQSTVQIVETSDKINGQNKCPKCGATETTFNTEKGVLVCISCRYEFQPERINNMVDDII